MSAKKTAAKTAAKKPAAKKTAAKKTATRGATGLLLGAETGGQKPTRPKKKTSPSK